MKVARVSRAAALLVLLSSGIGAHLHAQETDPGKDRQETRSAETAPASQPIAGVLKRRDVNFVYRSQNAPLSCQDIRDLTLSILLGLGARQDLDVRVTDCDFIVMRDIPWRERPWQASTEQWRSPADATQGQAAQVRVRAMMPVEMTPAVISEIQKDKSRRDLVSRVNGDPLPGLNDPIIFPAQRRRVTLSQRTVGLELKDCQLLDQMSSSLFPRLDIRVVRRSQTCGRGSLSPPEVVLEAVIPVMPATPQLAPPEGESEPAPSAPEPAA